jgi:hypothetical protein
MPAHQMMAEQMKADQTKDNAEFQQKLATLGA